MKRRELRPAIFLDRDGTLIHDRPGFYLRRPEQVRLYPYACEALKRLRRAGFRLVIVSNQSGIGRGFFDHATLGRIHRRLKTELGRNGAALDGIFFCPHAPKDGCRCRKPSPLLAQRAARKLRLDLRGSYLIGDKKVDVDMARALGIPSVHLKTGHGRDERERYGPKLGATHQSANLLSGANGILRREART